MARLVEVLVLPPLGLFLLIAVGLLVRRRRPRAGRVLLVASVTLFVLLSIPAVSGSLICALQQDAALSSDSALDADAIVVISAGADPRAPEYGRPSLDSLSLQRTRYAAWLQRRTGLPLLTSGGPGRFGLEPLAESMRRTAVEELGAEVRWTEGTSSTTWENALFSAPILREAGVDTIALVTHAWHMPRARACFESQGIRVVAAPTAFRGPPIEGVRSLLPSWSGHRDAALALHEMLGWAYYRCFLL